MELSLNQIAELLDGEVFGDLEKIIRDVAPFETANDNQITFADSARFYKNLERTAAGAVIVPRKVKAADKNIVKVDNHKAAFARLMDVYHPAAKPKTGIRSTAVVGKNFKCGKDVSIAPMVVIGNNVSLGHGVILYPGVVIGDNVLIGDETKIYPNVTVQENCRLGNRVIIHAGTVIGSDGYGFVAEGESYRKIPQLGFVQIDDDVEIGACNTIDRATFGKTWIQRGVKTDNLVHIAHNVTVGKNTVIVAQTGIAGSSTIGNQATLAAQVGIGGHVHVGDNVMIGARGGVTKSVANGEIVSGFPEIPHRLWLKVQRIIPRLPEIKKKLAIVEKRLKKLEEKLD
ncbi:MAG: UDP-3-O-(3-hydroxymyristoyl)glucosamine N-acyltransferase [Deltaproteobacteria bacterium]|nr:MAG: UDP-3-O-(3-hydroxymyristoyl)glucosamine N-acyltransferase [Deltaproteobacteria bacterium]